MDGPDGVVQAQLGSVPTDQLDVAFVDVGAVDGAVRGYLEDDRAARQVVQKLAAAFLALTLRRDIGKVGVDAPRTIRVCRCAVERLKQQVALLLVQKARPSRKDGTLLHGLRDRLLKRRHVVRMHTRINVRDDEQHRLGTAHAHHAAEPVVHEHGHNAAIGRHPHADEAAGSFVDELQSEIARLFQRQALDVAFPQAGLGRVPVAQSFLEARADKARMSR